MKRFLSVFIASSLIFSGYVPNVYANNDTIGYDDTVSGASIYIDENVPINVYDSRLTFNIEGGVVDVDPSTGTIVRGTLSGKRVVIPSSFGNIKITKIGDSAFDNYSGAGWWEAEENNTEKAITEEIIISEGIEEIGELAFFTSIAYASEKQVKFSLPSTLRYIGNGAFNNTGMTSITIPQNVTYIGGGAFANCNISSFTLPKNVQNVGGGMFSGNKNLKNIYVDASNNYFVSVDGVLFDKSCKKLL
mgnify:CR=1 FL=1